MNLKLLTLSALVVIFTSGCSGTYHSYYETLRLAFVEQPDAHMTLAEVQQSKVDVISVKRGERSAAIMALAYLENGQHKWVSSDKAMLIMEQGRIVRTLGFKQNLLSLSATDTDPLKSLPYATPKNQWRTLADYSDDQYGYPLNTTLSPGITETLEALLLKIDTLHFVENVSFAAPTDFIRLHRNWQNHYWYDTQSGALLRSIQRISPLAEPMQVTYLSRIARLNQK